MARSKIMKKPWSMASRQAVVPTRASVNVLSTLPSMRTCRDSALVFVRLMIIE
jgi:hypothetical protein